MCSCVRVFVFEGERRDGRGGCGGEGHGSLDCLALIASIKKQGEIRRGSNLIADMLFTLRIS